MAKIIKKGNQLEEEYYAIKREQADKSAKNVRAFCKLAFVSFAIYGATITVSIVADILSIAFIPLTMCLGFVLLIAAFVYFAYDSLESDTDILIAGINGERTATKVLSTLPDCYTVFQNVIVTYDNKKSEIDNIVVGRSGVFIVEVKNHNSLIEGDLRDVYWRQHKVGRGGTPYTDEMYSPVKQVGTQIYCLANYLRQNGVNTYIQGIVYFANKSCFLSLTGDSDISVYASSDSDEDRLCRQILLGNHNLDLRSINHICKLISQL
ncbi:MAG: NERD domain-containing protein [Lachnospiraceae bacterium]|nr:NERD domain-containing protein [Lachnospiraceae bacterium]